MSAADMAILAADAAVVRRNPRKMCFARSLVIALSVTALVALSGIIFFPPGASAGGPSVRVVIRTADGDLRGAVGIVESLGGAVERHLERTESIVAVLPQDSLDELWSFPSVLGVTDEGTDSRIAAEG